MGIWLWSPLCPGQYRSDGNKAIKLSYMRQKISSLGNRLFGTVFTPFLNILKNPNFFVRWQRCQFRNDGVKISIIKVSRQGEKSGGPCIFIQMRHFLRIRRGIYGGPYKCVISRRSFGHYSLSQLPFQSEDHEMSQDVEAISSILKHGI